MIICIELKKIPIMMYEETIVHIDGLAQDCSNSTANALEILLS